MISDKDNEFMNRVMELIESPEFMERHINEVLQYAELSGFVPTWDPDTGRIQITRPYGVSD